MHLIVHPVMKVRAPRSHRPVGLARTRRVRRPLASRDPLEVDRRTDAARTGRAARRAGATSCRRAGAVLRLEADAPGVIRHVAQLQATPAGAGEDLAEDLALPAVARRTTTSRCSGSRLRPRAGRRRRRAARGARIGLGILRSRAPTPGQRRPRSPRCRRRCARRRVRRRRGAHQVERALPPCTGRLPRLRRVQRFDAQGSARPSGSFVGPDTSSLTPATGEIPQLRRKVRPSSSARALPPRAMPPRRWPPILEAIPARRAVPDRDRRALCDAMGILRLASASARGCSCAATPSAASFVPVARENYNTHLRARMQALLSEALQGVSSESRCSSPTRRWRAC